MIRSKNPYLHIGNGKSLRKADIIGIFDLDTATVSKVTKQFIKHFSDSGKAEYADADLPRSFLLTDTDGEAKITLSRLSVAGLQGRAESEFGE